jgi:hydroxymethylglutaryl-CoA lyase
VGLATPALIGEVLEAVADSVEDGTEIGVHLHSRPEDVAAKVAAAWRAGCRRFDMAVGGYGGCPFAQDALVGNLATELAVAELERLGATLAALLPLDSLRAAAGEIERKFGPAIH